MIIWLASYPRSGNTLLRLILSQAFGLRSASEYDEDGVLPGRGPADLTTASAAAQIGMPYHTPREETWHAFYAEARAARDAVLIKTHGAPPDDSHAIYVVRDGRSAVVSYFHFLHHYEQARRMGWMCDVVVAAGHYAIGDLVCPTQETRAAFGPAFTVFVDTISAGRYADTNAMFERPLGADYVVPEKDAVTHAARIREALEGARGGFDWRRPTALFVGRYQPFHEGHRRLVLEGLARVGQACIAVRDTHGIDGANPFPFEVVRARIHAMMSAELDRLTVIRLPNITNVFYGRDVGYAVERIDLPPDVERISATALRAAMGETTVAAAYPER